MHAFRAPTEVGTRGFTACIVCMILTDASRPQEPVVVRLGAVHSKIMQAIRTGRKIDNDLAPYESPA
jgi:hypothetical protein